MRYIRRHTDGEQYTTLLPPVVHSREVEVVEFVRQMSVLFGGVGLTLLDLLHQLRAFAYVTLILC